MSNISQNLINAMGIIAEDAVKKAGYDKTIQVQILSCQDQAQGKYRCRFQDAIFYAYSNNPQVTYTSGSFVYVLVPGNNMSGKKNIVGSTQQLGVNYIPTIQADEYLDPVGINCVQHSGIYYLNSDNKDYKYDIYSNNHISLDNNSLNNYIKRSSYILLGANFKTNLNAERQYRGHFGITFKLVFNDNATGAQVIRTFTIDQDNMVGNPYRLLNSRQYQIFPIDGVNFVRFAGIEIFNSDFPNANGNVTTGLLNAGDISIQSIEIQGANKLSQQELNGIAITFYTPNGTFFNEYSPIGSSKQITAQIRVKGKITNSKNIPFYWGIQNVGITNKSKYYNRNLGRGWKCLNQYNTIAQQIQGIQQQQEDLIQWIPNTDTYYFKLAQATARQIKLKVAAIYQDNIVSKEIILQNYSNNIPQITIESNNGTEFYLDSGTPELTCKVDGVEHLENIYRYYWGTETNTGYFVSLAETVQFNNQYEESKTIIQNYKNIENPTQQETQIYQEAVALYNSFEYIQRVKRNKIYKFQINNITNFIIVKCSVYKDGLYIGTASIKLTNSLTLSTGSYSLVLENGSAIYKYDQNGVAPNSKSLQNPIEIKALSFSLYDNFGQLVNHDDLFNFAGTEIKWQVPIKNTLIQIPASIDIQPEYPQDLEQGEEPSVAFYNNIEILTYNISTKYSAKKTNNQIKLHIKYQNINLVASTQFLFVKQGQNGTNGTDYILRIIPNTGMSDPPPYPIITRYGNINNTVQLNYNIGMEQQRRFNISQLKEMFKVQFWHNEELLWQGTSENTGRAIDEDITITSLKWEILKNKYSDQLEDYSILEIPEQHNFNKNLFKVKNADFLSNGNYNTAIANIVKCTLTVGQNQNQKVYYATIPVVLRYLVNDTDYNFYLKQDSGFMSVVYTQDGYSPQYDSSQPFKFYIKQTSIDDSYEETQVNENIYSFSLIKCGETKNRNTTTKQWDIIASEDLIIKTKGQEEPINQFGVRPAARYSGWCVNNGIICQVRKNNSVIGRMFIPIHLYLNRFVFSHLNDWDGNSIQINDQGGYILSPQMGAGFKDSNNAFTGILIGQVKDPNKGISNIGLLGYNAGQRTMFLNSENGSAIFGNSQGRIVIDPQNNDALLYGGNYWNNYDQSGLPSSYEDTNRNENGLGLLINLSKAEIKYANDNFSVDSQGYLIAKTGQIGSWIIKEKELTSQKGEQEDNYPEIHLISDRERIVVRDVKGYWTGTDNKTVTIPKGGCLYSGTHKYLSIPGYPIKENLNGNNQHDLDMSSEAKKLKDKFYNGFYLGSDGFSIGNYFKVTSEGKMYIGPGAVQFGGIHPYSDRQSYYHDDGTGGYYELPLYWILDSSNRRTYLRCENMFLYPDRLEFNFNQNNYVGQSTGIGIKLDAQGLTYKNGDYISQQGIKIHVNGGSIELSESGIKIYRNVSGGYTQGYFELNMKTGKMFYRGSGGYRYQEWGIKRDSDGYFEFYTDTPS